MPEDNDQEKLKRFAETVKAATYMSGLNESTCMDLLVAGWTLTVSESKFPIWIHPNHNLTENNEEQKEEND